MYGTTGMISSLLGSFDMAEVSMRYSRFMPRLYNLAISLGFEPGKIMPSRAFCSDESQGYPVIMIAKHFGTFPFNHGLVGGVVATDRHGPHAHHGKDMLIIQASHVGYDPDSGRFGVYRRLQTEEMSETSNCGKICGALDWYLREYEFARNNIYLYRDEGGRKVVVDNQLLHAEREEGLLLKTERLVKVDGQGNPMAEHSRSTAKVFPASETLLGYLKDYEWKAWPGEEIGGRLHPDLFYFKRGISHHPEGRDHLEKNLLDVMPYVVTSRWPALTAAQANTQVEFDRAFRTIVKEPSYKHKKILFISGLNVDISPRQGQLFPLTKFIPWAAYFQDEQGHHQTWEQAELYDRLQAQPLENPDQVDMEEAIRIMEKATEIHLPF
ncbi:MAG: hypothetical protein B0D96_07510 [Candidatus Sedimenticola endophacoides]|uniref:Limiting CO2-inducible protein B/C beta carbonyic anhydrase domain-containing protein n=1 Tax=Candidatus Sedimenticola endophacoides TaxID=2548426 RepID=A0A657PXW3_9GAMM|nr:MAG: hypothetical protein B0D94_10200 [Candidatus Sedimenticola endophacoides]OQX33327.1 MAG: hypothetical protein B0D84_04760 [Candidatus Sedimenticola endophacoides]OQX35172.1 MAG: hypothetical protein B0D96_07510 [Candidatus Sedimenticola endophacoides]OQX41296.1 MAG: hypothetical protein B0D89_04655 [Candidatus Sedimenticola endophacoides]OQX43369.1 MAG: hypothetical protein B0D86_07630 [Candidatus Sedimenticola endophacoides]